MKQCIMHGLSPGPYNGQTRHDWLCGSQGMTTGDWTYRSSPMPTSGWFYRMVFEVEYTPGAGNTYIATLMKDGNATALSATIENPNTRGYDKTNRVHFNAGENVCIRFTESGAPSTGVNTRVGVVFEADDPKECIILGGRHGGLSRTAEEWGTIMGGQAYVSTSPIVYGYQRFPAKGTLKNFYFRIRDAPGAGKSWNIRLYVDGADKDPSVTIADSATQASDLVNTYEVSPGELVSYHFTPTGTPAESTCCGYGCVFVPDSRQGGESVLMHNSNNAISSTRTEFLPIESTVRPRWGEYNTENSSQRIAPADFDLYNMYIRLNNSPGADNSYTFTIRANQADTPLTMSIADTDLLGQENSLISHINEGDLICLEATPAGGKFSERLSQFGVVQFMRPRALDSGKISIDSYKKYNNKKVIYTGSYGDDVHIGTRNIY